MSEQICQFPIIIDHFSDDVDIDAQARAIEHDSIVLADIVMRFAQVQRVPRYSPETRENNVEHSFMLGFIGQELAAQYFPGLDPGLVAQYALVHDLLELKTGDVASFSLSDSQLKDKATAEHAALGAVCAELTPYNAMLLRDYEEQTIPETRFVRFIDKLMPVLVDILGPGSQVMHEDYTVFTHEQLDKAETALKNRFLRMFPDIELDVIHTARNILAERFAQIFQPAPYVQELLF